MFWFQSYSALIKTTKSSADFVHVYITLRVCAMLLKYSKLSTIVLNFFTTSTNPSAVLYREKGVVKSCSFHVTLGLMSFKLNRHKGFYCNKRFIAHILFPSVCALLMNNLFRAFRYSRIACRCDVTDALKSLIQKQSVHERLAIRRTGKYHNNEFGTAECVDVQEHGNKYNLYTFYAVLNLSMITT